jgi:hypothetical protein
MTVLNDVIAKYAHDARAGFLADESVIESS